MKTLALLFAALLACACASPTAVMDKRTMLCDSGQDIGILAGLEDAPQTTAEMAATGPTFLVEVSNNSHGEVTVKSIRIEPSDQREIRMDNITKMFNETIAENDEHLFRLPVNAPWNYGSIDRQIALSGQHLTFFVTVSLTNGDTYRCPFEVTPK